MPQWFLRFSEFTEFNESTAPFRKNSIVFPCICVFPILVLKLGVFIQFGDSDKCLMDSGIYYLIMYNNVLNNVFKYTWIVQIHFAPSMNSELLHG